MFRIIVILNYFFLLINLYLSGNMQFLLCLKKEPQKTK